jgi:hypothetical protein
LYSRLQDSIRSTASAGLANQCASRHSARSVPLELSTYALSVGLPEREKSIFNLVVIGPEIQHLIGELTPVITEQNPWCASLLADPLQDPHHIMTLETLAHFDSQAFPRIYVDYRQRPELAAIGELIAYEVHAPDVIRSFRTWLLAVVLTDVRRFPDRLRKPKPSSRYKR